MLLLDFVVRLLSRHAPHGHGHSHDHHDHVVFDENEEAADVEGEEKDLAPGCISCSPDPVGDLEILQHQADEIIAQEEEHGHYEHGHEVAENVDDATMEATDANADVEATGADATSKEDAAAAAEENRKLAKMGINTAIAIGLHNFPEGLATFVAALDDPRVGAVLAIAIGIHNIPEGLCVALPIYYATGNRMKAFLWALLSGASEPLAALLGWAVLANSFSDHMYAVLFGLVAGMMVIISIRELLPTAHRYDPEDTVVTYSFIIGMGIMALSLVLFVV